MHIDHNEFILIESSIAKMQNIIANNKIKKDTKGIIALKNNG